MEPTLVYGRSILVDHANRRRVGHILVVRTDDGLVVKRVGRDASGAWQLISDNPDKHVRPIRPWPYDAVVVGEVKWTARGPCVRRDPVESIVNADQNDTAPGQPAAAAPEAAAPKRRPPQPRPRLPPPPSKPRWVDRSHIAAVLAEIPASSVTRARLEPDAVNCHAAVPDGPAAGGGLLARRADPHVAVPRGKGGRIAAVPVVREGVVAVRAFLDAKAFGPWPRSSVNGALASAARRAGRDAFTTYQIRHSFAAGLWRAGTDVADIQDLSMDTHAPKRP